MLRFIVRRALFAALSLLGLVTIVFAMIKLIPGDEAAVAAGAAATPEMVQAARERLGLDQPLPVQYLGYLGRLLHGDLGTSITTFQPVATDLVNLLPSTLELVLAALVINVAVSVPIAALLAAQRERIVDRVGRVIIVLLAGMPVFWAGFLLQIAFSRTHALPISGALSVQYSVPRVTGFLTADALLSGQPAAWADAVAHLVLPAIVLAIPQATVVIRAMRTSLIGQLAEEYVMTAKAKGASPLRLLFRHALRNALVPSIATIGLQVGYMVAGAVIVESVFSRPGIGAYLTSSVTQKDSFAVLGAVIVVGAIVIVMSLLVDLLQMAVDPRVRRGRLGAAA